MRLLQARVVLPLVLLGLFGCATPEPVYYAASPPPLAFQAAAATLDVVAENAAISDYNHRVDAKREERAEEEGQRAYAEAADKAAAKHPERCTEVHGLTLPEPAPGHTPPRAFDCNGRLLVQDDQGRWLDYAPARASAQAAP